MKFVLECHEPNRRRESVPKLGAPSNLLLIAIAFLFNATLLPISNREPVTLEYLSNFLFYVAVFALIPALLMLVATAWMKRFSVMLLSFICLTVVPTLLMTRGQRLGRDELVVCILMQIFISYGAAVLLLILSFVSRSRKRGEARRQVEMLERARAANIARRNAG
ncbi:hypothetical protein [Pseudomonas sp. SCB32]|uniref:hypothetical protein n=1 Tax=Pseudomonas sp. SCB32 TaxID=2653853 RepID=UPI0015B3C29D|nr:hypothetical protein [Pseudomonas sp. SCB32]